jgi:hypothetical protein
MKKKWIPPYFAKCWHEYESPEYADRLIACSALLGMHLDFSKAPFVCVGNLKDRSSPKLATFGLAPHSAHEVKPRTFREYLRWRQRYFDRADLPHPLHGYFAMLLWGALDVKPPAESDRSRWLHRNGYLSFDMVRYYTDDPWRTPRWRNPGVSSLVREHFLECMQILAGYDVRLAVFSGKAWREILVDGAAPIEPFTFERCGEFALSDCTLKEFHGRLPVAIGRLRSGERAMPAFVVGGLIHMIRGLERDAVLRVGMRCRAEFVRLYGRL